MVGEYINEIISVSIEVELETLDQIKKVFGKIENENTIKLCDGKVELRLISTENNLAFDGSFTVELVLAFSIGIASGIVGNAFYAAICAGIKKIAINGRRTRITEESITEALETVKNMESSSDH